MFAKTATYWRVPILRYFTAIPPLPPPEKSSWNKKWRPVATPVKQTRVPRHSSSKYTWNSTVTIAASLSYQCSTTSEQNAIITVQWLHCFTLSSTAYINNNLRVLLKIAENQSLRIVKLDSAKHEKLNSRKHLVPQGIFFEIKLKEKNKKFD